MYENKKENNRSTNPDQKNQPRAAYQSWFYCGSKMRGFMTESKQIYGIVIFYSSVTKQGLVVDRYNKSYDFNTDTTLQPDDIVSFTQSGGDAYNVTICTPERTVQMKQQLGRAS